MKFQYPLDLLPAQSRLLSVVFFNFSISPSTTVYWTVELGPKRWNFVPSSNATRRCALLFLKTIQNLKEDINIGLLESKILKLVDFLSQSLSAKMNGQQSWGGRSSSKTTIAYIFSKTDRDCVHFLHFYHAKIVNIDILLLWRSVSCTKAFYVTKIHIRILVNRFV